MHSFQGCPVGAGRRAFSLNPNNTPAHILLGLPTKLGCHLDEFFFPFIGPHLEWPVLNENSKLLAFRCAPSRDASELVRDAEASTGLTLGEQVMQMLTQTTGPPDALDVEPEIDAAPDHPNGFSVGPSHEGLCPQLL